MDRVARKSAAPADPGSGRPAARTLPDLLLGLVGGAMVIGALVVIVFGGERDTGANVSRIAEAPQLTLAEPAHADTVSADAPLVFRSSRELRLSPQGWGVDSLHIHAAVNGRDVMPAAPDIVRRADGGYAWHLRRLPPGPATLRLYWSGPDHRPMEPGATETIQVYVR
jgi:hypothetical protein